MACVEVGDEVRALARCIVGGVELYCRCDSERVALVGVGDEVVTHNLAHVWACVLEALGWE